MKNIFMIMAFIMGSVVLSSCAQQSLGPQPEIPGAQQYYQMPGPYYTSPPPQLQYWDPRQDPMWQEEHRTINYRRNVRRTY